MRLAALAFLAGVILLHQLKGLPDPRWALLLPVAVPAALAGRLRHPAWMLGAWLAIGFLWTLFRADLLLSHGLSPELEGKDLLAQGTVVSVPVRASRGLRFDLAVERLSRAGRSIPSPGRVRVTWYEEPPEMNAGDRWQLTLRLKRPRGFMNPGGFDYEAWLLQHRVRATGYVRSGGDNRLLSSVWWSRPVDRMRQRLAANIQDAVPHGTFTGVLKALAIGERDDIAPEQWEVFRRTGTTHLVAISGLHIGLIAAMMFWLARWLWVIPSRLALRWPAPKAAAVCALIAAAAYAALAGFSIPTQRALIMLAAALAGLVAARQVVPTQALAAALLAVLLWDPFAVLSAGFWLSFAAVAAILYTVTGRAAGSRSWTRWGRAQWAIAVGLLPLSLLLFHRATATGLLANLVAIPMVGFLVLPLTLIGTVLSGLVPGAASFLLMAAEHCLGWLWALLQALSSIDAAQWQQSEPALWAVAAATVGVLWLLAPRGVPSRWLGALWLLPLFLSEPERPAPGDMALTVLDVGQGLAAVVRTHEHVLVYDAGPRYSADFDAGGAVVVPFLQQAGVHEVDRLVLSHGDNDHVGGAESVVDAIPVKRILSGTATPPKGPAAAPCAAGQHWAWDGVTFRVLHPPPGAALGDNDASCVLYVDSGHASILLAGDIGGHAEQALLEAGLPRSTVMVVPHHGSSTSSTVPFVEAVHPEWALFSAGYRNQFGFPRRSVVRRYQAFGARVLNTAEAGAITLSFEGSGIQVDRYRVSGRHWWTSR
jgi:competence protein ComEC